MKQILLSLPFCLNFLFAQDSIKPKTKRFNIEVGIFNNMPFKNSYEEINGSLTTCYSEYKVNKFQTIGCITTIGFQLNLTKNLYFAPSINYQYLQLKTEQIGYTTGSLCTPVISGLTINTGIGKHHLFGVSMAFNYTLKNIKIENGVGIFFIGNHYVNNQIYSFYNKNDSYINVHQENFIAIYPFSYHKIGFELLQNELDLYIGVNINYSKKLTQSVAPNVSLKFKL